MNRYFESSYLVTEILPKDNIDFIQKEIAHLKYLLKNDVNTWKHSETSDYYFNQRPIGDIRPFPFRGLNILTEDLKLILSKFNLILDGSREFVPDQSMEDYIPIIHQSTSYSSESFAIFYRSDNEYVTDLWFDYNDSLCVKDEKLVICDLLHFIGQKHSLILVNWYKEYIFDLSDKAQIWQFLNELPY
jgi:hypothetical protein